MRVRNLILKQSGGNIHHIFDNHYSIEELSNNKSILIVGNGLSAIQTAIGIVKKYPGCIYLLIREKIKLHQFDTDPGWIGPKYLKDFQKIKDYTKRRSIINTSRNQGSIPSDINTVLNKLVNENRVKLLFGEVQEATFASSDDIRLLIKNYKSPINVQTIILATGFSNQRPGGLFIDQLISEFDLPCAECGYPIVDASLSWHPGLYVSGPLAELEIGPVSRNIIGARLAGRRLFSGQR